jgi:hypothetical protein
MNDQKLAKWLRVYEEMERANLILRQVQRRLSAATGDEQQLTQEVKWLARRGNAVLQALHDAYRAASDEA